MLYGTQNEYWFIFLGVTANKNNDNDKGEKSRQTADIDYSTNLSANQASYTLMIS